MLENQVRLLDTVGAGVRDKAGSSPARCNGRVPASGSGST